MAPKKAPDPEPAEEAEEAEEKVPLVYDAATMALTPASFVAEEAAEAAMEDVIISCGNALYDEYIKEKAYKFAAQTITEVVVGHLRMCFVQHDPGDMKQGSEQWEIEAEVPCSALDSWCRRVVPIQNRPPKLEPEVKKETRRRGSPKKGKNQPAEEENKRGKKKEADYKLPEKLPKPVREVDEYEDMLREYKLRQEKRNKELEEARKKSEAEEQERQRQLEKFKEELAKRQITYNSKGEILFVNPPNVNKLPPSILSTGYKLQREEEPAPPEPAKGKKGVARGRAKPKKPRKTKLKDASEFTDSFSRLTTLQPPAYEVMQLEAGMELEEQSKTKRGPPLEFAEGKMTRSGYKLLCDEERGAGTTGGDLTRRSKTSGSEDVGMDGGALSQSDAFNREIAQMDPNLWGRNPPLLEPDLRSLSAQAPNTVHDWRQKREAVGNLGMHPRDRIAELGSTSGWRLPQPPLGATMGHGLLKGAQTGKEELHYFPDKTSALPPHLSPRVDLGRTPPSAVALRQADKLPALAKAPSLPALAQTQGSTYPWMDPGVMDVRFARSHSGGAITSSKSEMLRSMLR